MKKKYLYKTEENIRTGGSYVIMRCIVCAHPIFFFPVALRPTAGHDLILDVSRSHTTTHHSR